MNSLKLIIPLAIIFALLGAFGVYRVYKAQTKSEANIRQEFFPSTSDSATPAVQGATTTLPGQPSTGQDELEIKNIGIQLSSPVANQQISSPQKVTGTANVTSQTVVIKILDSDRNTLGWSQASACVGLNSCQFEAIVTFQNPNSTNGYLEIYSPSTINGSKTFLQTIPVAF